MEHHYRIGRDEARAKTISRAGEGYNEPLTIGWGESLAEP